MSKFPSFLCGLALSLLLPPPAIGQQTDYRTESAGAPASFVTSEYVSKNKRHRKPRITGDFIAASRPNRKAIPRKEASANPTIYANIIDYATPGIYSFTPEKYEFTPVVTGEEFTNSLGSAYANGILYGINDNRKAYKWNSDDWSVAAGPIWSELVGGTAMAANPIDGTLYSCAYDILGRNYDLVLVDPDEFVRATTICRLDVYLAAMFFDNDGTLWGFDADGKLYTVDTSTGTLTLKGDTGIAAMFDGAAAVDPESGVCYYAVCDWECSLYEVNLETAEAFHLYDFDDEEELKSIFFLPAAPDTNAPDIASAFSAKFADGSLSGTVSFTAPEKTFGGSTGSGTLNYTLSANGEAATTGTCQWGSQVNVDYTAPKADTYTFSIIFHNDAGESRPSAVSLWVGKDTPSPVANVRARRNGSVNVITWDPSQTSTHNGYVDFDAVTYKVVRMPDEVVVAEGISATAYNDELADGSSPETFTYEVSACWDGNVSEARKSNTVMTGVVYYNNFDEQSLFDDFLSISLVTEGPTWSYNSWHKAAAVGYNEDAAVSAWLISPAFDLIAGAEYTLTFTTWCSNDSYDELMSVFITESNAPSVIYGATPVISKMTVNWESTAKRTITETFTPSKTGKFYLTFNGCSPRDYGTLYLDDVIFYRSPTTALPEAPAISAALEGELTAKVTITAPANDTDGAPLAAISRITLSRDETIVKTFTNPTPGATLSFSETLPQAGSYYYTAVAYNDNGRSADATALLSAVVPALPQRPSGISFAETSNDGEVTISWEAPSIDVKGQPLDPSTLTYNIYVDGSDTPVANGLSGTSYTYQAVPEGEQKYLAFKVSAVNSAGESYPSSDKEPLAIGTPTTTPFSESFAGMQCSNLWSFYNPDDYSEGQWIFVAASETPAVMPVDSDGGMLAFAAEQYDDTAIATTGKIDLGQGSNPRLSFYYYANTENKDILNVSINDGSGFKVLFTKVMRDDQMTGWAKATIDLAAYAGKTVRLRFQANSQRSRNFMLIDKIDISSIDNDLEATMLSAPSSVKAGLPFTVKTVVTNNGTMPATGYTVVLYRDGAKAAEIKGNEIAGNATALFDFEQTSDASWNSSVKYSFGIEFAADQMPSNNLSESTPVEILFNNYPVAQNLKAYYTDANRRAVSVEWAAPDQANLAPALYTEDFEFFTPFEADPVCDWTFIDGDGDIVFGSSLYPFDGQNDPKAFVVLDADHFNRTYEAHSGRLYMASFSASTKQTDDWMISPELTGEAQTVKLFVRSYSDTYGLESFELLYSTTGKDRDDFISLSTNNDVPTEWTEYTADLPEGALYFAVRCISNQRFALFVDDITYIPAVNPATYFAMEGFNIYRDGVRLNSKPLMEPKYTDAALPATEPSYMVSVVYDHGESPLSAPVTPSMSGITEASGSSVSARAVEKGIEVTADGANVAVYAADGKAIHNAPVSGKRLIPAATGVYIVSSGKFVQKVIVR